MAAALRRRGTEALYYDERRDPTSLRRLDTRH
jgi:hypothetical protein